MNLKPQRFPKGCVKTEPSNTSLTFCNYGIGVLALTVAVVFASFAVMFFFYPEVFGSIIETIKQFQTT